MAEKAKTTSRKRRGTLYKTHYPQVVEWMAKNGLLHKDIAKELGISPRTLERWKKEYPELKTSLKKGCSWVDRLVEGSLLKRAMGFEVEETKNVYSRNQDGKPFIQRAEKTLKHYVPDVLAQIFWLKNRQPARWRDVQHKELSGEVKGGFNFITHPEEEGV